MRHQQLGNQPLSDPHNIIQINQFLKQEAIQFRNQMGSLITTNRQIQTQLR